jgi:hypothetical protein
LTSVGEDLQIYYNDALSSLTGLANVADVGGSLWIYNNPDLVNLTGLNNVMSVGSFLQIEENDNLNSLTGLNSVTKVCGDLYLINNYNLSSISGLESLDSIGGALNIWGNISLKNLVGLDSLHSVGGFLGIAHNDSLTTLSGLDNMDSDSVEYLYVIYNGLLSDCAVNSICDYIAFPSGSIEIHDNDTSCNSPEEVELACSVGVGEPADSSRRSAVTCYPNPAFGHVFFDFNLQTQSEVNLSVFNSMGQLVAIILDESLEKGDHQIVWNAGGFPAGIYFYRFSKGSQAYGGKLIFR